MKDPEQSTIEAAAAYLEAYKSLDLEQELLATEGYAFRDVMARHRSEWTGFMRPEVLRAEAKMARFLVHSVGVIVVDGIKAMHQRQKLAKLTGNKNISVDFAQTIVAESDQ